MPKSPEKIVKSIANELLADCDVVLFSGSFAKLEHNFNSDIDVVAFSKSVEEPFRQVISSAGWPVELFVFPAASYRKLLEINISKGVPTLMRMIAEGKIIVDNGSAAKLKQEAAQALASGPREWTLDEMNAYRFQMTEHIHDLEGTDQQEEAQFIAVHLLTLCCHFWLRVNRKWIGEGKWLKRELERENPPLYHRGVKGLQTVFQTGESKPLIDWADRIMLPYGGRLYEGYMERAEV